MPHTFIVCTILAFAASLMADEASILAALKSKGAEITETKGAVTGVSFKDCSKFSADDFASVRQITTLKQISLGMGANDATLTSLGELPELESLGTNGLDATDDGIRALSAYKKLKSLAMFHPGRKFTGTGLAVLKELPAFESLTVAGSQAFSDAGMDAVATITQLKGFRVWHTSVTLEGIKKLSALKNLTGLTVGMDLGNGVRTRLSDDALPGLAGLPLLESLSLMEARLSLPALAQLKQAPKLKSLTLNAIEISDSDLTELKQQLPKVTVHYTAPNDATKKRIDAVFDLAK